MDKQTLSEAISNAKRYAKNLKVCSSPSSNKYQSVILNSYPKILSPANLAIISSAICMPIQSPCTFSDNSSNKAKSKVESMTYFKQKSPPKIVDKSGLNTTSKLSIVKKQVQSESQRENNFQKSQNSRMQSKHLSSLFAGSLGSKEITNKKNGHNHTYTHLNDLNSDKFSEMESNIGTKANINRLRHSKSPSKQRHAQLNYTTYADQIYKKDSLNYSQAPQRSKSEKKQNWAQVGKLVEQINRLEEIIKQYKCLIMQIKIKYQQIQSKLAQKVMNDHFIDVLKLQIQQLQDKNNQLNLVISKQNEKINSFQLVMIDKITKVNQYYSKFVQDRVKLEKQNEMLKNMLIIATQSTNATFSKYNNPGEVKKQIIKNVALQRITMSVQKFTQKWS